MQQTLIDQRCDGSYGQTKSLNEVGRVMAVCGGNDAIAAVLARICMQHAGWQGWHAANKDHCVNRMVLHHARIYTHAMTVPG